MHLILKIKILKVWFQAREDHHAIKPIFMVICSLMLLYFVPAFAIDISPGMTAPGFSLRSIEGKEVSLNQYKNSVVILIYWKSNQIRSLLALQDGQDIADRFKDRNVQVIGLTAEVGAGGAISTTLIEKGINFPVLIDPDRKVFGDYGIHAYPSTVLIDRGGQIVYTLAGHALTYKHTLEGHIQYVLGEIDEKTMKEMVSPRNENTAESILIAHSEYNLALTFTEDGHFDLAVDAVKRALKAKGDMAESHVLLGFLYIEKNEAQKAFAEFSEALKLNPHSHDARTGLGAALILKGDIENAIEVLTDALSTNPYSEMTYYELGRAYEMKGENSKSKEMYKRALQKIVRKKVLPSSVSRCR